MPKNRGNRDFRVAAAKAWGHRYGYHGNTGGWIYKQNSTKPVCLGWDKFFSLHRAKIRVYMMTRVL